MEFVFRARYTTQNTMRTRQVATTVEAAVSSYLGESKHHGDLQERILDILPAYHDWLVSPSDHSELNLLFACQRPPLACDSPGLEEPTQDSELPYRAGARYRRQVEPTYLRAICVYRSRKPTDTSVGKELVELLRESGVTSVTEVRDVLCEMKDAFPRISAFYRHCSLLLAEATGVWPEPPPQEYSQRVFMAWEHIAPICARLRSQKCGLSIGSVPTLLKMLLQSLGGPGLAIAERLPILSAEKTQEYAQLWARVCEIEGLTYVDPSSVATRSVSADKA